jgi:spermidine synthase
MLKEKNYFKHSVKYTNDGKLIDEYGRSIMMEWETEWMKESAKIICENGGDILNIGFGMGIVDTFIQSYKPNTHTIIEAHPDIYLKMLEYGWPDKPNVNIVYSKWQDAIDKLPKKYDGIYFDTWMDEGFYDLFLPKLDSLLKPNGIFSYWVHTPFPEALLKTKNKLLLNFDIDYKIISIENTPTHKEQFQNGGKYWNENWKECLIPIIKKRKTPINKTIL